MTCWVVKLRDGKFVGNLISGPNTKSFVRVELKDACQFFEPDVAIAEAKAHGASDFVTIQVPRPKNTLTPTTKTKG